MQEVFTSVAKAIRRFDPAIRGRFRGWLWTITRNKIRDHHRRSAAEPEGRGGDSALRELAALPEVWDDDASEATRHEVRALYHRALELIRNDFELQTWQAFWLSVAAHAIWLGGRRWPRVRVGGRSGRLAALQRVFGNIANLGRSSAGE